MQQVTTPSSTEQLNTRLNRGRSIKGASTDSAEEWGTDTAQDVIQDPVEEALKVMTPAWPLQNTVAVNPFWNLRSEAFWTAMTRLKPSLHQELLGSLDFFRQKYAKGEITVEAIGEALSESRSRWKILPKTTTEFLSFSNQEKIFLRKIETIAEVTSNKLSLQTFVVDEIGKFASAYFDQKQALIKFPWKSLSFWNAWLAATKADRTLDIAGFTKASQLLTQISTRSPKDAIDFMLSELKITSTVGQYFYLQRAAATVIGWGSQFRYHEWQKGLGYAVPTSPLPMELLAVRVAYDWLIYKHNVSKLDAHYSKWSSALDSCELDQEQDDEFFAVLYTWQLALEISYQKETVSWMARAKTQQADKTGDYQLVFCIDVRSEMIRRHIESSSNACRTRGFAGFFGATLDYKKFDEKSEGHRLPVLLKPGIEIAEPVDQSHPEVSTALSFALVRSFFRNLRKAPLASFLFVELFGILSVGSLIRRCAQKLSGKTLPERFKPAPLKKGSLVVKHSGTHKPLTVEDKAAIAANAITHLGIRDFSAKMIVIVGHGADTTNNAFGSSLDCGACGGHAGDVNAKVVVDLLNDKDVRSALVTHGFVIPDSCWFVAALHETVTDEVYFLDEGQIPQSLSAHARRLKEALERASETCRNERQTARSDVLDSSPARRSTNWAEVRPEWGLSGNASFIVAPRERTLGVNLSSRAFLHDYEWRADSGFKTLELIMTAPMVVTNWINMQYFASVVAPSYYGSGNKVLHNLTNEIGVVEGNGGDLRVGLPMQSVHDGEKYVHDPLRLTVFIEAPRVEIEKIINKHQVVAELVNNQWLHIAHIDPQTKEIYRRLRGGEYTAVLN
jgi:uncharacterized protein YbcC (UPF0753/DUF2309 family)